MEGLLVPTGLAGRPGEGLVGLGTAGKGWPVKGLGTLEPKLFTFGTVLTGFDTEPGGGGGATLLLFPPLLWTL